MKTLAQQTFVKEVSANHPFGAIINETDTNDGTPVVREVYNDLLVNNYKLLQKVGITANNLEDNEVNGYQIIEALQKLPNKLNDIEQILTLSGTVWSIPLPIELLPNKYFFFAKAAANLYVAGATRLCGLYNIGLVIADTGNKLAYDPLPKEKKIFFSDRSKFEKLKSKVSQVFGRTSASPTESVKGYLAKLASQKNLILSHTNKGEVLLFSVDYDAKPAYFFTKGNTISMDFKINGQGLHSEINVVRQPSDENAGVSTADKAINTLIPIFRPTTKILTSGTDTDVKDGADNELAAELRGITLTLKLQGVNEFLDLSPGDIINVHNHYIYCYAYNRFMIETITFNEDPKESTTEINCLIPESFTGGPKIRNIFFNHNDTDYHIEEHLNEETHLYMNRKDIL